MTPPLHISRRLMVSAGDHYAMAVSLGATGYWPLDDASSPTTSADTIREISGASDSLLDRAEVAPVYVYPRVRKLCNSSQSVSGMQVGLSSTSNDAGIILGQYRMDYPKASFEWWMQAREQQVQGSAQIVVPNAGPVIIEKLSSQAADILTFYSPYTVGGRIHISCNYHQPMHVCITQEDLGSSVWSNTIYINGLLKSDTTQSYPTLGNQVTNYMYFRNMYAHPSDDPWITYQCAAVYQNVKLTSGQVSKLYNAGKL